MLAYILVTLFTLFVLATVIMNGAMVVWTNIAVSFRHLLAALQGNEMFLIVLVLLPGAALWSFVSGFRPSASRDPEQGDVSLSRELQNTDTPSSFDAPFADTPQSAPLVPPGSVICEPPSSSEPLAAGSAMNPGDAGR